MPTIPAPRREGQEDLKFEANLGYRAIPCFNTHHPPKKCLNKLKGI
jgi:hypothetical protein